LIKLGYIYVITKANLSKQNKKFHRVAQIESVDFSFGTFTSFYKSVFDFIGSMRY